MTGMNCRAVVEEMAENVDERRRQALRRRAAYLALARAILADEPEDVSGVAGLFAYGHATPLGHGATAA